MSSASPGRYQSRLFNFLNRQSIRLTDRIDRTVRHLKVAAAWGAQILLYPVYLLTQGGLAAGRQLSSTAQAGLPELKAFTQSQHQETLPTADTPIQRVLGEVSTLDLPIERLQEQLSVERVESGNVHNNLPTCQPIQGLAALVSTRTLVLVTVENQILDILTPAQQQKLSAKISWEVADLLRQWRLSQASKRQFVPHRLTHLDQPRVFLPVRLFWQLMAWVQTSPVAIAANLFQESTLVAQKPLQGSSLHIESSVRFQLTLPIQGMLTSLDHTVAELESHQLVPGSEAVIVLRDRVASQTHKLAQQLQKPLITSRGSTESPEASQANSFQLQALIYAAIDYFFGRHGSNLPGTDSQERSVISANYQGEANQLLERDSNFLPPLVKGKNTESQTHRSEVSNSEMPVIGNSVWSVLRGYLSLKQPLAKLSEPSSEAVIQTANFKTQSPHPVSSPSTSALPTTEASQTNPFGIQALIYAAIDYFFGKRGSNLPLADAQERSPILANSQGEANQLSGRNSASLPPVAPRSEPIDAIEPDAWLTWSDLFGNPDAPSSAHNSTLASQVESSTAQAQLSEPINSKIPTKPRNSVWSIFKRYLSFKQTPGMLSVPTNTAGLSGQGETAATKAKRSSPTVVSSPSTSVLPAPTANMAITNPATSDSDTELKAAPDWIETQATPVGYVKHPLEQLLGWLDLAMLWLEELTVKIWQWVTRS